MPRILALSTLSIYLWPQKSIMEVNLVKVMNLLSSVDISIVISYSIAFISILLSVLAYIHSRRTQKPKYLISSASLRNEVFENSTIKLRQGNRDIPCLTISKFALWNTGITLNKEDIAERDPIRITTNNEAEILEVQELYSEDQNNYRCEISEDKHTINMSFDYFAKNQGVVLKIFHTGTGSFDLSVKGALKNGEHIGRSAGTARSVLKSFAFLRLIPFTLILRLYGIMFVVMGIFLVSKTLLGYANLLTKDNYGLFETILMVLLGIAFVTMGWGLSRRILPNKLDKVFGGEH